MSLSAFWADIDRQLAALESARTGAEVIDILPAQPGISVGDGFFEGSGGDGSVYGSLVKAGWTGGFYKAPYHWSLRAPNGDIIEYVEGDIYSRPAEVREVKGTRPRPGDVVRLDGKYWGAKVGARAVINGGGYWDLGLMAVFGASAFRGPSSKYSADQAEYVSCSGGPCPCIPEADLTLVGTTVQTFWKWADRPRAGGGVNYQMTVNLWSWGGAS